MKQRIILFQFIIMTTFCLDATSTFGQNLKSIWTIEFVKAKHALLDSAVLAYQKNWGDARKYAKKMKFIKSYQLLIVNQTVNAKADYDILLITEYTDTAQYNKREENFNIVFKKYQPDWVYINGNKTPREYTEKRFDYLIFEGALPFILKKE